VVCTETQSADPDASWLKKGSKFHFGYRSYVTVDAQDGYVRGAHTAPANESEVSHLEHALDAAHITPTRLTRIKVTPAPRTGRRCVNATSKAPSCTKRKEIHHSPLGNGRLINSSVVGAISSSNASVRQNDYLAWGVPATSALAKVNAQIFLKGLCMNLLKAANPIFIETPLRGVVRPKVA
jgi:IS5 family transposase